MRKSASLSHVANVDSVSTVGNNKGSINDSNAISRKEPHEVVWPAESPVGRLKNHVESWKAITDESYTLDVLQNVYKFPM